MPLAELLRSLRLAVMPSMILWMQSKINVWKQPSQSRRSSLARQSLNTAYDYLEGKEVEAHVVLDNQLVTQDTVDSLVTKE